MTYEQVEAHNGTPIKMWTHGVPVEDDARAQLLKTASLPFIFHHLAVMPDVHLGKGSTIGSVIPTQGAIIPAAVGVDIGCGMSAVRTMLKADDLGDLPALRAAIEGAVPHGREVTRGGRDKGTWENPPDNVNALWAELAPGFEAICAKYPCLKNTNNHKHLGTLGTGNHFIEVCLDEADHVWFMLHSGSRGIGHAIGELFIGLAQKDLAGDLQNLPDPALAYLTEGTELFADYLEAVHWAQEFARLNRVAMMQNVVSAVSELLACPVELACEQVDCHHNYVQRERHFGNDVYVTRKGAVSARAGEPGIIPGSMGASSFIVRGLGNPEAFTSCSHGAGRAMSRNQARKRFSVEDQIRTTAHVECRKDANVIDEIPLAYKDIDAVMQAQRDLVEVVHQLHQVVCVKG